MDTDKQRKQPEIRAKKEGSEAFLVANGITGEEALCYQRYRTDLTQQDIISLSEARVPAAVLGKYENTFSPSNIIALYRSGISSREANRFLVESSLDEYFITLYLLKGISSSRYKSLVRSAGGSPRSPEQHARLMRKAIGSHFTKAQKSHLQKTYNLSCLERYSIPLLEELLLNRDPAHNEESPAALVVLPKSDWNGTFLEDVDIYQAISKKYKLFVYEARVRSEVFRSIRTFGSYQGITPERAPQKPLELLILAGHGSAFALNLGDEDRLSATKENFPYALQSRYLSLLDEHRFRSVAPFVTGTVLLFSCLVGEGGKSVKNLATSIFTALPCQTLIAPQEDNVKVFAIDLEPFPFPIYSCGKKRTLVLER
ncbi:hypothetical protein HYS49_01065 [Candidatus Woesearchaeota archaeon]|nr:hypothetical protein [Candidatus Woesearchaeota archaeon]